MASKKIYAVKVGRNAGIYYSWNDCKKQIDGYSGAVYKSFTDLASANSFLEMDENKKKTDVEEFSVKAYVDGSYDEITNRYSYGCVIIHDSKEYHLSGIGESEYDVSMRNVSGELLGAQKSIEWAIKNNQNGIVIYHDYIGIQAWADGDWSAKKNDTKSYSKMVNEARNTINISFVKVKAHSGNKYNELADELAKKELWPDVKMKEPIYDGVISLKEIIAKKPLKRNKYDFKFSTDRFSLSESAVKKVILEKLHTLGINQSQLKNIYVNTHIEKMVINLELVTNDKTINQKIKIIQE